MLSRRSTPLSTVGAGFSRTVKSMTVATAEAKEEEPEDIDAD